MAGAFAFLRSRKNKNYGTAVEWRPNPANVMDSIEVLNLSDIQLTDGSYWPKHSKFIIQKNKLTVADAAPTNKNPVLDGISINPEQMDNYYVYVQISEKSIETDAILRPQFVPLIELIQNNSRPVPVVPESRGWCC